VAGAVARRAEARPLSFQMRTAITHLHAVLTEEGIGCVKIVRGDPQKQQSEAVQRWNVDPECPCFLLHAGTAAAGLTLTAAQHVFLLEPFGSEGEQLQAMNRTHRIGQTKQVFCTTLFMRGSVEERTLWHRARKAEQDEALGRNRLANGGGGGGGGGRGEDGELSMLAGGEASSRSAAANDLALQYTLGMVGE
jgi:SNF2 family DNA or RNA helicase